MAPWDVIWTDIFSLTFGWCSMRSGVVERFSKAVLEYMEKDSFWLIEFKKRTLVFTLVEQELIQV
jgi:hypothetical protein